jgi:putative transposase
MLINVPPKLAVSSVVGYIKGKSAIHVARHFLRRERIAGSISLRCLK